MLLSSSNPPPPSIGAADPVRDVDISAFMVDVIDASRDRLVLVEFWATWCGPCKQLMPVLEKLTRSHNGAVLLAKIDIDKNQQIAQKMGVQSVPAVFAFYQGKPVDGFMGALPEPQIKTWIDQLLKATSGAGAAADLESALKQAEAFMAEKNIVEAQSIFGEVLEADPTNAVAYAGLIRTLLAMGEMEGAKQMFADASPEIAKHSAMDSVRTTLELAEQASNAAGALDELLAKVQADPADHQARFDLAMAQYAAGQREDAVDSLLEIVRRNRAWNEDAARKQLVKFFEAFGMMDPLTVASRKRLSSIMYS